MILVSQKYIFTYTYVCFENFKQKKYIHRSALWLFLNVCHICLTIFYPSVHVPPLTCLQAPCRRHARHRSALCALRKNEQAEYRCQNQQFNTDDNTSSTLPPPGFLLFRFFSVTVSYPGSQVALSPLLSFSLCFVVWTCLKNTGQLRHGTSLTVGFPSVSLCLSSGHAVWAETL